MVIGEAYPLALLAAPPPASPLSRSRSPPAPPPPATPLVLFFSWEEDSEDDDDDGGEDWKGCLVTAAKGTTETALSKGVREVFSPSRTEHWMGLALTLRHSNDTRASSTPAEMNDERGGGVDGVFERRLEMGYYYMMG